METVTITGMEIVANPKPSPQNNTVLAYFTADVGVFSIKGCLLIRTARQGIAAWLPRLDHPNQHNQRRITLNDEPTRNAMLQSARDMYILMGGKEAEWRKGEDRDEAEPEQDSDNSQTSAPARMPVTVEVRKTVTKRPPAIEVGDKAGVERFLGVEGDTRLDA